MELDNNFADPDQNGIKYQQYLCRDLDIETVIVYLDQAELSRKLDITLDKGVTFIKLLDVSQSIVPESIRIEPGNDITLLDVSLKSCQPSIQKQDNELPEIDRSAQLKVELARQKKYQTKLSSKLDRLIKQQSINNCYIESLLNSSKCTYENFDGGDNFSVSKNKPFNDMVQDSAQTLEKLTTFFEQYEVHASRLEDQIDKMRVEIDAIAAKVSKTQLSLENLEVETDTSKITKDLVIKVESPKEIEQSVYVFYTVSNASWKPQYDIRVSTGNKILAMSYYGIVQQSSGEDWNNARLSLSTGSPAIGCKIPELGTQKLMLLKKKEETDPRFFSRGRFMSYRKNRKDSLQSTQRSVAGMDAANNDSMELMEDDERTLAGESMTSSFGSEEASNTFENSTVIESSPKQLQKDNETNFPTLKEYLDQFKESMSNTMYEINQRVTVKSDTCEKVTIATIDIDAQLIYESVPRKSPYAFLKAYVENTTPYIFVEGAASVFLNGIFVSKTTLKQTCPKEKFSCQLGIDSSVQIDYKPLCKYREHVGYLSKNVTLSYKQIIEIRNLQCKTIHLLVTDHVPISTDEKIKVSLLEPSIKSTEKYDTTKSVRLNRYNNIEWDLELKPNDCKELLLKYTVEHPVNEDVDLLIS